MPAMLRADERLAPRPPRAAPARRQRVVGLLLCPLLVFMATSCLQLHALLCAMLLPLTGRWLYAKLAGRRRAAEADAAAPFQASNSERPQQPAYCSAGSSSDQASPSDQKRGSGSERLPEAITGTGGGGGCGMHASLKAQGPGLALTPTASEPAGSACAPASAGATIAAAASAPSMAPAATAAPAAATAPSPLYDSPFECTTVHVKIAVDDGEAAELSLQLPHLLEAAVNEVLQEQGEEQEQGQEQEQQGQGQEQEEGEEQEQEQGQQGRGRHGHSLMLQLLQPHPQQQLPAQRFPALIGPVVVFPGCIQALVQVMMMQAGADLEPRNLQAALQRRLPPGAQLVQVCSVALQQQGAAGAGIYCEPAALPCPRAGTATAAAVTVVLPVQLLQRLTASGRGLRVVVAAPSQSVPLSDKTLHPGGAGWPANGQLALLVRPPAGCHQVLLHLLGTPPAQQPVAAEGGDGSDEQAATRGIQELLMTLPLLVLPELACAEVGQLWAAMVAQWRQQHPGQGEEEAAGAVFGRCFLPFAQDYAMLLEQGPSRAQAQRQRGQQPRALRACAQAVAVLLAGQGMNACLQLLAAAGVDEAGAALATLHHPSTPAGNGEHNAQEWHPALEGCMLLLRHIVFLMCVMPSAGKP